VSIDVEIRDKFTIPCMSRPVFTVSTVSPYMKGVGLVRAQRERKIYRTDRPCSHFGKEAV
jgi:hypothetical protein